MHVEQGGSRKSWNPIASPDSVSPEPSATTADLPVEREAAAEAVGSTDHVKDDLFTNGKIHPHDVEESTSYDSNGMIAAEEDREADDVRGADDGKDTNDGREADDYGDFQESWGENAVKTSHDRTEDVAKLDGSSHLDQSPTNFESAEVRNFTFCALLEKNRLCG